MVSTMHNWLHKKSALSSASTKRFCSVGLLYRRSRSILFNRLRSSALPMVRCLCICLFILGSLAIAQSQTSACNRPRSSHYQFPSVVLDLPSRSPSVSSCIVMSGSVTVRFFDDGKQEVVSITDIEMVDGSEMPAPIVFGCFVTVRGNRRDSRAVVIDCVKNPPHAGKRSRKRQRTNSTGMLLHSVLHNYYCSQVSNCNYYHSNRHPCHAYAHGPSPLPLVAIVSRYPACFCQTIKKT